MLRSLYSGVSGMRSQQIKLDVIGNNIANVNTVAFKGSRVTFKDMLNQTLQGTSAPNYSLGGTNAQQAGLGVAVASIDTNMNQGALQQTGRSTDLAIEGNGFFIVSNSFETKYTRDGSFKIDKDGALVTSEGLHVRGAIHSSIAKDANGKWTISLPTLSKVELESSIQPATIDGNTKLTNLKDIYIPLEANIGNPAVPTKLTSFTIEKDGLIKAIYGDVTCVIGRVALATFQNQVGLLKNRSNLYTTSSNSGEPQLGTATDPGFGTIQQGMLEMSNVDLVEQFTELITASRAFQANSRTITTSDEILQELLNLKR